MPLKNSRKLLKLLQENSYMNDAAFETLDLFFPEWVCELSKALEQAKQESETAQQTEREIGSRVACFGTMATAKMRAELTNAQRSTKRAAQNVKQAKTALERCGKIKNAYDGILR